MRGFRDTAQRLSVVRLLGRWLHKSGCGFTCVTSYGPSAACQLALDNGRGPDDNALSAGQLVMLSVLLDLWDGSNRTFMVDLVDLDGDKQAAIGRLIAALGAQPSAVDNWLVKYTGDVNPT